MQVNLSSGLEIERACYAQVSGGGGSSSSSSSSSAGSDGLREGSQFDGAIMT